MVHWNDLGAGLRAAPGAAARLGYWWEVLRRLLLSHVFLGYALVAAAIYFGGRSLLTGNAAQTMLYLALVVLSLGPAVVLLPLVLLMPYSCWVFAPAAARVLPQSLDLPPSRVAVEPPFWRFFVWGLPALVLVAVVGGLYHVPGLGRGDLAKPFGYACGLLLGLAFITQFARGVLAMHYASEDVTRFLRATRLQRVLLWLPVTTALGLGTQWAVARLMALSGTPEFFGLPTTASGIALLLALYLLESALLTLTYAGTLLLACARFASPPPEAMASETMVMPPPGQPFQRPVAARRRWSWPQRIAATALVLLGLPGAAWLGRAVLLDWYFSQDAAYQEAIPTLARQFARDGRALSIQLEPGTLDDRLRAGYVVYGCLGQFERAHWLEQVVALKRDEKPMLLACAACENRPEAVDWVLTSEPGMRGDEVAMSTGGEWSRPRTALSCAATANDLNLARRLLAAGASGADRARRDAPVQLAIERRNWPMAKVLMAREPQQGAGVVLTAMEQARARDPASPAQLVPGLVQAGLPLASANPAKRNLFHHAAMWHDLPLARALLAQAIPPEFGPHAPDLQGALPWMHVLRKAELDRKPMSEDAVELLRLLLPPGADVNLRTVGVSPAVHALFPAGWSAGTAALSQPAARAILGPDLDFGLLPTDPATWWKFGGFEEAEVFVRTATPAQLERVENPQAPEGLPAKKLSAALVEAGWTPVAEHLLTTLARSKAPPPPPPRRRK